MENSILTSVKEVLGIAADYTAFDEDILMHINSTFSDLTSLGIGPVAGFTISDADELWSDYVTAGVPANELNSVRSYVFLKVRLLFDPPGTSYLIELARKQIEEYEFRLGVSREYALYPYEESA